MPYNGKLFALRIIIYLLKIISYLKPYKHVQTNDYY